MNDNDYIVEQDYETEDEMGNQPEEYQQVEEVQSISTSGGVKLVEAVEHAEMLMDKAQNLAGMYHECMALEAQTQQVKTWGDVKMTEIIAKFKSTQDFLQKNFGQRDRALNKIYGQLDRAVESNDREMIIEALHGISSIVTKSPLEDFDKFVAMYNDTSKPIFDF